MSGPYGPNDPNGQWAQGNPDPNGGYGAPQVGQPGQQPQWGQQGQPPQWAGQPAQPQQPQPGQPQWGPQPDQQWGQPQWGQQPGQPQWGAPNQQPNQPAKKSKAPLFVIIAVVVVFIIVAGGLIAMRTLGTHTLDQAAAEAGVEKIVTESYGAEQVEGVSCPADQAVEEDASFDCSLTVDGAMKTVTLTFTDDEGTYEVSRPS